MKQQNTSYSIFCDESCHLQYDGFDVMCIGAIVVPDSDIEYYKNAIKKIKRDNGILHELKWNTISQTHLSMYNEIIRLFFNSPMTYRSILIKKKSNLQAHSLDSNEYNHFYYSVIERLIRLTICHTKEEFGTYKVFLDIKDNHGKIKLSSIEKELKLMIDTNINFISLQNIRSHESQFIQLADIITGAITYRARKLEGSKAKVYVADLIESMSGYYLSEGTEPDSDKFTIYDFQPQKRNS